MDPSGAEAAAGVQLASIAHWRTCRAPTVAHWMWSLKVRDDEQWLATTTFHSLPARQILLWGEFISHQTLINHYYADHRIQISHRWGHITEGDCHLQLISVLMAAKNTLALDLSTCILNYPATVMTRVNLINDLVSMSHKSITSIIHLENLHILFKWSKDEHIKDSNSSVIVEIE